MKPAIRLTGKCRAPAAGQTSRLPACRSGRPNGHDEYPGRRNTILAPERTGRRMLVHDPYRCRMGLIAAPNPRRRQPNPHSDCGDA
jgi:hypothetical protein